jgi:hypothetical protein
MITDSADSASCSHTGVLPSPTPPPVMKVIMIAVMAHIAEGNTRDLKAFVRCTTSAF